MQELVAQSSASIMCVETQSLKCVTYISNTGAIPSNEASLDIHVCMTDVSGNARRLQRWGCPVQ